MIRVECRGSFMAHPRDSDDRTAGGSLRIWGRNPERVMCQCAGFCLMGDALPGQAFKFKPTVTSLVGSGRANTQAAEEALEPSSRGVLSGGGRVGLWAGCEGCNSPFHDSTLVDSTLVRTPRNWQDRCDCPKCKKFYDRESSHFFHRRWKKREVGCF